MKIFMLTREKQAAVNGIKSRGRNEANNNNKF
jgi:hypothetical protein